MTSQRMKLPTGERTSFRYLPVPGEERHWVTTPVATCLCPLLSLQANSEEAEGREMCPTLCPTPVAGGQREAILKRQEGEHTLLLEEGRSAA